jgi:hypothetical protein
MRVNRARPSRETTSSSLGKSLVFFFFFQQNFHLLSQLTQVTNVVIGSSALLVCSW